MTVPTDLRTLTLALREMAEPLAERQGLDVVAVELLGVSGSAGRILRISLDKPGGATVGDCARFSRLFSPLLDVADHIATAYTLEVSTPGIDRPLQRLADFARFVGCTIRLKTWGMDGRRKLKAVIVGVDGDEIVLSVDGAERRYLVEDVERANLVLDLEQFARLGQGLHPIASEVPAAQPSQKPKPSPSRSPR